MARSSNDVAISNVDHIVCEEVQRLKDEEITSQALVLILGYRFTYLCRLLAVSGLRAVADTS